MTDPIRQPAHYRAESGIEAIDVIRAWGLSFSLGSALKYLCRAGIKPGNSARQDLQKLIWYAAEELGGKALANEVAQLVAMELADVGTPRLLVPAQEEDAGEDEVPLAPPTPALMPVDVTPDVTPAPIAVIRRRTDSKLRASRAGTAREGALREQIASQELISSADLAERAGIGASGISWHVREGNLTPAIRSRGGYPAYFTPEEAQRFLSREDRLPYAPPPDPALWMSVQEAARALSMSESAVKRNAESGRLESVTSRQGRVVQRWIKRDSLATFSPATRKETGKESLRTRTMRMQEVLAANPDLVTSETARQILGVQSKTGARAALHKAGIEVAHMLAGFTQFYRRADVESLAAQRAGDSVGRRSPSASHEGAPQERIETTPLKGAIQPETSSHQPEQAQTTPAPLDGIGPAYRQERHMEYMACIAEAISADLAQFWVLDIEEPTSSRGKMGSPAERVGNRGRRRAMLLHSTQPGGSALSSVALAVRRCGNEWVYRSPEGEMVTVGRRQAPDSGVSIPSTTGALVRGYGAPR